MPIAIRRLICIFAGTLSALTLGKLILCFVVFISFNFVSAQESTLSPELQQMQRSALEKRSRGDLAGAIILYRQAIKLAADKIFLYKELASTLYQAGRFGEVEETLQPVLEQPGVDDTCYRLLASGREMQGDTKGAKTMIKQGLARFAGSGLLYEELGTEYDREEKPEDALETWLDGMAKVPGYSGNYYQAAQVYLGSRNVLWGLVYGEMFLYMTHDTINDDDLKQKMLAGYKVLFDNLGKEDVRSKVKTKNRQAGSTFENAVLQVYTLLTPVVSDGVTAENLTMVRTRFLMEWFSAYADKFPCSLFTYQDMLLRNGRFDIANQWIFGKAESAAQYLAWSNFHEGDVSRFRKWQSGHLLQPAAAILYNDRNMEGMFGKKKN